LPPTVHQGRQGQGINARQRPEFGSNRLGEVGQYRRVQGVGLGQLAGGLGEVTHLPGVDDDHGVPSGGQGRDDRRLEAAGSLQDDPLGA
jgi:hypothetical protein